jgi:signal transduction histidine kinase
VALRSLPAEKGRVFSRTRHIVAVDRTQGGDPDFGADPDAGTGLRGLIDRVEGLGGRLEVQSPVERGTTVRASLPEI